MFCLPVKTSWHIAENDNQKTPAVLGIDY